jgi:hypothetical protein
VWNWLDLVRWFFAGFLGISCVGIAAYVVAKEWRDMARRSEVVGAFAKLQEWAGKNDYTILFREQVRDTTLLRGRSAAARLPCGGAGPAR